MSITSLAAAEGDAPTTQYFVYLPIVNRSAVTQVANGNFESGVTGWTVYSVKSRNVIRTSFSPNTVTPLSGAWGAWLGGMYGEITHLEQSIKIYAGTAYLTYWQYIASSDYCGYDFARVTVNGTQIEQYDLCTTANTNGWRTCRNGTTCSKGRRQSKSPPDFCPRARCAGAAPFANHAIINRPMCLSIHDAAAG
ncbi:MAG: hypothetical protein HY870_07735 [Chloroflexi bacterium]|nr:hypothetical protein [Chloroflexota bacterium]